MEIEPTSDDIQCPITNEILPQVTLRWSDYNSEEAKTCGVVLTNFNWHLTQLILVRAVVDGKKDGDQERSILVKVHLTRTTIFSLTTVMVNIISPLYNHFILLPFFVFVASASNEKKLFKVFFKKGAMRVNIDIL